MTILKVPNPFLNSSGEWWNFLFKILSNSLNECETFIYMKTFADENETYSHIVAYCVLSIKLVVGSDLLISILRYS